MIVKRPKPPRPSGAFGLTEVTLTPRQRQAIEMDLRNCPHCGVHHASLDGRVGYGLASDRVVLECPSTRRLVVLTLKLFIHPV